MRQIIFAALLAVVMVLNITNMAICVAADKNIKDAPFQDIVFDVPSHWTTPSGTRPQGAHSFLKQKSPEERILIHVRASALTKTPLERANDDIKILQAKKLTVEGMPKSIKLGRFQWVFFEVKGPTKDVAGRPDKLFRLQYYTKEKDTLIEAYLMAMGKSFDKNDRKEFENFLTTIRLK